MTNSQGEFDTYATLNSLGYRNSEFTKEKREGSTRILIIGDSMTFGWGVSDEETYPYLLEKFLQSTGNSNVEVINGGYVGGLSPDTFYVYLKNSGIQLKPDIVILNLFVWNDISDIAENSWEKVDTSGLPERIESCCHVVDERIFRNKVIDFKYRYPLLRESHFFILLSDTLGKYFPFFRRSEQLSTKGELMMGCVLHPDCIHLFGPEEQKLYTLITAMKQLVEQHNSKFIVVLMPVDVQLYPESGQKYSRFGMKWYPQKGNEDFIQKRIKETLLQEGISVFDLFPEFDKNRDNGYSFFPIDAHFNAEGTRIVAESVAKFLRENTFLPK